MLIEAAFFRFCEGMLRTFSRYDWTEEQIRGLFAQSIVDELSSRLIKYPSLLVHIEKQYQLSQKIAKPLTVDICADFSGKDFPITLNNYGFSSENWIEIKYFHTRKPIKYNLPKVENVALIVKDMLRLIILTGGKTQYLKRYLIIVFDNKPDKYLAMKTKKNVPRTWLEMLFDRRYAEKEVQIDFSTQPDSFSKKISSSNKIREVTLTLNSETFLPKIHENLVNNEKINASQLFVYCYLFRIERFKVTFVNGLIPAARDEETYRLCCSLAKDLWA